MAWLTLVASAAAAEFESKVDRPYEIVVCLRFSDDARFTRLFVEQLRRQTRDQLANYFGKLAEVRAVAPGSPPGSRDVQQMHRLLGESKAEGLTGLLQKVETAGLAGLELSPAEFAAGDLPGKVFLMTVDFDGRVHRIRWRQLDADVQQIGPVYGRWTPDRQWLAKAICLAVKEDFAPVAVVRADPYRPGKVTLEFRGSALQAAGASGTPLLQRQWLADGCVLQPFWVIRQGDAGLARRPIPHTVLQIEPGGNWRRAAVVSSLQNPWRLSARVAGFQAIKLTTRRGRFRLHLVDAETGNPVPPEAAMVYANDTGFEQIGDADLMLSHDREGYVVAQEPFDDVAYVKISSGGGESVQIALPITDAWVQRQCRIRFGDAGKSQWRRELSSLVGDLQVLQTMMDEHVRAVNELNHSSRFAPALERLRSALESLQGLVRTAGRDLDALGVRAKALGESDNRLLAWAGSQIQGVRRRQQEFTELADALKQKIQRLDAQNRAQVLIKLAAQAENTGQIDDAIDKYQMALKEWPDSPKVKRHLDQLKQTWKIKGPQHQDARNFVFAQWAKAKTADLQRLLPKAQRVFALIARPEIDDQITARRLLKVNGRHLSELTEMVDWLAGRSDDPSRSEHQRFSQLAERLVEFQLRVSRYLQARSEGRRFEPAAAPDEGNQKNQSDQELPGDVSRPPATEPAPEKSDDLQETEEPLDP